VFAIIEGGEKLNLDISIQYFSELKKAINQNKNSLSRYIIRYIPKWKSKLKIFAVYVQSAEKSNFAYQGKG
jgi:predicted CopG family antitoxin